MTGANPPSPVSHDVRLRMLGSVELEGTDLGDSEALLRQPKRLALVAFLILDGDGGYCPRDRLLSVFWPGSDDQRARGALRQGLSFLRQTLGEDVLDTRGRHAVRVSPDRVWCDALRFGDSVRAGRQRDAMELYRGTLLEGFHVQGSQPFDAWLTDQRRRYQRDAAEAAWTLAERAEAEGDGPDAAYWGKRALELSSFEEHSVRRVVGLLGRVGDRTGALRAYRGLRQHLREEYDATPSPETERLVQWIRERETPRAWAPTERGRRSGVDRRSGDRRRRSEGPPGEERRSGRDRRQRTRRSGLDRRHR